MGHVQHLLPMVGAAVNPKYNVHFMADYSLSTALSDDCNDGKFDLQAATPLMLLHGPRGK